MTSYPLLDVRVTTPTLELRGATDNLLDELAHAVREGKTHADPLPYDDPISLYEPRVLGGQWGHGAVGNAKWTGVRLREIGRAHV